MPFCCFLCGIKIDEQYTTRSSTRKGFNAILLSALMMHGQVEPELLTSSFLTLCQSRKSVCVKHYINAAQFIMTEVTAKGGKLSETADHTAYINQVDISPDIPAVLNSIIRTFTDDVTVSTDDIFRYLNIYIKKYYSENSWIIPGYPREVQPAHLETIREEPASTPEDDSAMDQQPVTPSVSHQNSGSTQKTFSTPSVKHFSSGSSAKTSGSCFLPEEETDSDSDVPLKLEETDAALMDKFFMISGRKLLELFNLARCGCNNGDEDGVVRLKQHRWGAVPIIEYIPKGQNVVKKWQGQETVNEKSRLFDGTTVACAAAVTTGTRITRLIRWAKEAGLLLPSRSTYYNVFKEMRPSIMAVHDRYHERAIEEIKAAYEIEGHATPWDIAVDGAFDSRGFSAKFCRLLALDQRTKLCIHTEIVHSSETDNISGKMEKEAFRRMLRWFGANNLDIRTISTDRSAMYGKEINLYNSEFGTNITWQIDPWHLCRYLSKSLHAAANRSDCAQLRSWVASIKRHFYNAVELGERERNGEVIKHAFNTCLHHVAGVHEWAKGDATGDITRCTHALLEADEERGRQTIAIGSPCHNKLKDIVMQRLFQRDLTLASPHGGTSQCESKHSLDRLYCPKEIWLPEVTYPLYAVMSTLHHNALQRAEKNGERVIVRRTVTHRKFNERETEVIHKSPIEHVWRKEIYAHFLGSRTQDSNEEEEMEL